MPELRTFECDICQARKTEDKFGDGFAGWGQVSGVTLKVKEGTPEEKVVRDPILCNDHLLKIIPILNSLLEVERENK